MSPQDELSYNWSVSNSGPSASTNTVLTATLDPGVTFVSATPDGACRRSGRTVTCSLGTLEANETTDGTIVVEVVGTASADLEFTAVARSDQLDRTPANNDDSESTELFAPPEQVRNLSPVRSSAAFIELSWARPSDNGSPITRYELERKEAGESYALVTPEPSVAATTYRGQPGVGWNDLHLPIARLQRRRRRRMVQRGDRNCSGRAAPTTTAANRERVAEAEEAARLRTGPPSSWKATGQPVR